MGEQQLMEIQLYEIGDVIIAIHDGGHRMITRLESLGPKGDHAVLQFGLSGARKIQLKPTPRDRVRVGRFYGKGMAPWHVDTLTVERLIETAKSEALRKKRTLNRAQPGRG